MVRAKHLMRPTLSPWVLVVLLVAWFITGADRRACAGSRGGRGDSGDRRRRR